jgi:hypothetical protein
MARAETDIRLAVLKQLLARGASIPSDALDAVLSGPELGKVDTNGRLRVTEEMIAPGSQWIRENRAEFNRALAENRVDIVD